MPQSLRLTRAGDVIDAPKSASFRVFIESGIEEGYAVSPEGFKIIAADREARQVFIDCATSFRSWLDHWTFIPEGKPPQLLGPNLWRAQDIYARATAEHDSIYFLKARQLGESTIACAYDGWRLRFGPTNCRVSVLAQTDENSKQFLADVMYGLSKLPPALRLPSRALEHTATLAAGKDDTRRIRSYPASNAIRSGSFSHIHLDEAAAMIDFRKTWRATEEAIVPGGTCHLLTTGGGGASDSDEEYRRAKEGNSRFFPLFIGALSRPDRHAAWYEEKRRTTDHQTLRAELPLTEEDALSGAGEYRFDAASLDICGSYSRGLRPFEPGRLYLIAVDPGEKDGTAIVCLDATGDRHAGGVRPAVDVCAFRLMRPCNLREAQLAIEQMSRDYPTAPVVIEINGIGIGLVRNLRISSSRIHEHNTTAPSKRRLISNLAIAVQSKQVTWDANACPDLDKEMRGYKEEDANIRQDCVMAVGVGLDNLDLVFNSSAGRLGKVIRV
jgi:hypothetical protein